MITPTKASDFIFMSSGIIISQANLHFIMTAENAIKSMYGVSLLTYSQLVYFCVLTYWGVLKIKNIKYQNKHLKEDEQIITKNRCSKPINACNRIRCNSCPKGNDSK